MKNNITAIIILFFCHISFFSQNSKTFCDGWKEGYDEGYSYHNSISGNMKPVFITPICPIPGVGFDTYRDGYNRGVYEGKSDFKKSNPSKDSNIEELNPSRSINQTPNKTYCDGWKEGYVNYSSINRKMKPIFITPICPIAKIGYDSYRDGYNRGFSKGESDFAEKNR